MPSKTNLAWSWQTDFVSFFHEKVHMIWTKIGGKYALNLSDIGIQIDSDSDRRGLHLQL